ncbi:Replication factor A C-terminal [Arabidopsis suecica]|uniref:Replication factor A C-terminal n=1 Tax=Arabidopsis suecica TaxID=45249 RepID=A0A8T1Z9J0_ARASU|nr:Replication factor A C-terminal [Arabidopsis suecica]
MNDNELIPKRDITLAYETKKTVVVSLWNDLATGIGQELLDMADKVIITLRSNVVINPASTEATKLTSWYDSEVDELNKLKSEEGGVNEFQTKLKEVIWSPHLFRISTVSQQEYNSEKRQRKTVRGVSPIDFTAETRLLLQEQDILINDGRLVAREYRRKFKFYTKT